MFSYPWTSASPATTPITCCSARATFRWRTGIGAMAISFYAIMTLSCMNDIIAFKFHISLNATTWMGRIGLLIVPPIAYFIAYCWALSLQRSDRAVLEHGIETGIIKRLPQGEYIEVHQPLGPVDDHGHPIPLPYEGAALPEEDEQARCRGLPRHRRSPLRRSGRRAATRRPRARAARRRAQALRELQAQNGNPLD